VQVITIKELNSKLCTYLEEAFAGEEIVVTKRGQDYITITRTGAKVVTSDIKYPKTVDEVVTSIPKGSCMEYGCGCAKVAGNNLCPKHSRI
jgi:hypothetical protein